MLDKHMPFPAFVLDRSWNVVLANPSAAAMIENWDAVAWDGLARLRQDASNHPDSEELAELAELAELFADTL